MKKIVKNVLYVEFIHTFFNRIVLYLDVLQLLFIIQYHDPKKKKKKAIIITNKLFIFHLSKPQALEIRGELKGALSLSLSLSLSLCLLIHHSESRCDALCGIISMLPRPENSENSFSLPFFNKKAKNLL